MPVGDKFMLRDGVEAIFVGYDSDSGWPVVQYVATGLFETIDPVMLDDLV
jgi:hypothetical protein